MLADIKIDVPQNQWGTHQRGDSPVWLLTEAMPNTHFFSCYQIMKAEREEREGWDPSIPGPGVPQRATAHSLPV